jgi:glucokinase
MSYALGIDLGGTKILAGVIELQTGEIVSTAIQPTKESSATGLLERLEQVAMEAVRRAGQTHASVVAAGIGAAGQVDTDNGVIIRAPNLPASVVGRPLAEELRRSLGCSVILVNDVVAAAAGEAGFGAGRDHPDFVCVFVGTGIGGAIYRDGHLWRGATNTAGELGHMVVDAGGRICGCGGRGHLEAYASHSAVMRTILGALRQGRESVLAQFEPNPNPDDRAHSAIRYQALREAVEGGDRLATEMVEEGARYLSAGLVSIVNFYNPPLIVLGGGMVQELELFFEATAARVRNEALLVPRREVEITRASLGPNSGIVGAALLAAERAATPA